MTEEEIDWSRPFQKGDMKHSLLEESSFAVLFPHYRERYLTEIWPKLQEKLDPLGIEATLDTTDGVIGVRTTDKTWDPVAILKCRDLIKLLARSVPLEQAVRVLEDGIESMVIVIGRDVRNTERFTKRRQRLIGPNGETLKALELLTQCYILVQGHTVAAIGKPEGLQTVQRVAQDCMKNIHPVYHIKTLMVKRELQKNPEMADKDWDRFLPEFKKLSSKKKKTKREFRDRSILPAYPPETETDRQIESGEYFLKNKTTEKRRRRKNRENGDAKKTEETKQEIPTGIAVKTEAEAEAEARNED
ncbi:KRR1 small subunit processome component like protein [Tritrichomonas foetus]|uniref:KRR1 small subunit processome component n=1 Tax=Tritrichomonas foetus TaxID=1144522 RepID=A0A1J4KLP4_9EUKA|nr:KRR1 small subunit processome component like protein [Tritrichomonas foetus]|eukprot:OHT12231.1 KRR1 small subunit processome component like protein [Tritrichomonas foetus]